MAIIKVLKRRDAASVIVAVIIAMVIGQMLSWMAGDLASKISGISQGGVQFGPSGPWRAMYLQPFVAAVLQLIGLEIIVRLYTWVHGLFTQSK